MMDRRAIQSLHPMLLPAQTGDYARELFWDSVTMYLESEVRPGLRTVYEQTVQPALRQALGREPDRKEIAAAMRRHEAGRWWYLQRTESQREGSDATRAVVERQLPQLLERAQASSNGPGSLTLDPDLALPSYLDIDIHLQKGGYFGTPESRDTLLTGAVYDRGMTLGRMGAQGWLNDDAGLSLAAWVKEAYPDLRPKRILEMGCTIGHTLTAFKQAFPDAEVHGIDVAAPALRYGFARAAAMGVEVHFSQQNAEHTKFADGSFDLVFSRILLHETSAEAVPRIFAECHRLLRPGGVMFHSDAPQFDELDPYAQSLRDWDATVNKEPFMDGYYAMPLEQAFVAAGFAADKTFRAKPVSRRLVDAKIDPRRSRTTGGRYFLAGAVKA
jgi:SAM-dependent methyltransferase